MGAITNIVKRYVPATYKAMLVDTTNYITLAELQSLADYVQFKLLATVAGSTLEATTYNRTQLEFLGKVTTLKFLPAAIDFWMDQREQVTLTGTNENISFAARLTHLREVMKSLAAEVQQEAPFVLPGDLSSSVPGVSYGDNGRDILITEDPQVFRPKRKTDSLQLYLPWDL